MQPQAPGGGPNRITGSSAVIPQYYDTSVISGGTKVKIGLSNVNQHVPESSLSVNRPD